MMTTSRLVALLDRAEARFRAKAPLYLSAPFLVVLIAELFLPAHPLKDERLFYPVILDFGEHFLPSLQQIRSMPSPMGPLFFAVFGFLGRFVGFSLPLLRSFNVLTSYLACVFVYRTLKHFSPYGGLLTTLFLLNPYFLLLTTPLLYTDNLGYLCLFSGLFLFSARKNRLGAALLWTLAVYTRQLFLIIPLSAVAADLLNGLRRRELKAVQLLLDCIPLAAFACLFVLWGFHMNAVLYFDGVFAENTVNAFGFSMRGLNYTIFLLGIIGLPFWVSNVWRTIAGWPLAVSFVLSPLLLLGFPVEANHGRLAPAVTAGYLDRVMVKSWPLSAPVAYVVWTVSLAYLLRVLGADLGREKLFYKLAVVMFVALNCFYPYTWEKHFILAVPLVFVLCSGSVLPLEQAEANQRQHSGA